MQPWFPNYQPRDYELVDYERFYVDGCDIPFRGPPLNPFASAPGSYFSCLGAVQTYGAFYEKPFPALLSGALGMPALNLAVGGAGPGFYLQNDRLIEAVNRSAFVILQCMAARHAGNSRHDPQAGVEFVTDRVSGEQLPSWLGWKHIVIEEPDRILRYVDETRRAWVEASLALIARITVPVVFFYYSRRAPHYAIDMGAVRRQADDIRAGRDSGAFVEGLMGDFPHLVDGPSVHAVAEVADAYVECLSSRGMGQALVSRFTGKPIGEVEHSALGDQFVDLPHMSHNVYYPSAEMHEDACDALLPVVRRILAQGGAAVA